MDDPDKTDHSIHFKDTNLRIPLTLNGIFSYVRTTKPSAQIIEKYEEVFLLTPSKWDPRNSEFSHNEQHILDWKGELVEAKHRRMILADVDENIDISVAYHISDVEAGAVTHLLQQSKCNEDDVTSLY